ncbi:lymphotactin-like isoform X2 [Pyxicephalus adspersus]|uniref:lymphotactin-like isoform X2 n=1 Tax=Pyxicephalus adspersus TaxID=30357 RepID=UPI003B59D043
MTIIHITPIVLLGIFLCTTIGMGIEFVDKRTCLDLQQKEFPLQQLTSYTRQTIPKEAILFKTKKGRELCADPTMPWVIKAVAMLDKKAKSQPNIKESTNNKKTADKKRGTQKKNKKRNTKKNDKKAPKVKPNNASPKSS